MKKRKNTKPLGSSETTREAFCFDLYSQYKPQHKKNIDTQFLQWFIGFSEGDCTFHTWSDRGKKRAGFSIDQQDPKVLFWLRENLGFGRVLPCGTGWRFQVWDQQGLFRLFCIFAGNIVLDKRHLDFEKWTQYLVFPPEFSLPHCSPAQVKENRFQKNFEKNRLSGTYLIGLDNAWLAGFWQADGGFYAWGGFDILQKSTPKLSLRAHIILRLYLTQHGEEKALQQIALLVQGHEKKLSRITTKQTDTIYNRLEFASESCLEKMLSYFITFPLVGQKNITFRRWKRIWEARRRIQEGQGVITEKSITKLKRIIAAVNKTKK